MTTYIIEGLDRLGKSTLIEGIKNKKGFHLQFHRQKPELLEFYINEASKDLKGLDWADPNPEARRLYQEACFRTDMNLIVGATYHDENGRHSTPIIFDRSWLGEYVYAPMYRKYPGDYVFDLEEEYNLGKQENIVLVLLLEDFANSKHFVDDGLSFDITKREEEQNRFVEAFNKSIIRRKVAICVTHPITGQFCNKDAILDLVLKA